MESIPPGPAEPAGAFDARLRMKPAALCTVNGKGNSLRRHTSGTLKCCIFIASVDSASRLQHLI
jgi:hypothetical protein